MRVPRGVRAGRLGPAVNSIRRKRLRREGGAVVVDPPINLVLPSITGSTIEGETLTGVEGTWTGDDIVFTYAWLRDGDPISSADEVTYTLVADDVGADIVLRVTATNGGGSVSADSAAVGPVEAPQDPDLVLVFDTTLATGTTVSVPLRGAHDVTIDWGDGTSDSYTFTGSTVQTRTKTYAEEGEYTVRVSGTATGFGGNVSRPNLVRCLSFGDLGITSLEEAFRTCANLVEVPTQVPDGVTTMINMFRDASAFNQDIGGWGTSSVTVMDRMFNGASAFNQDISAWDVSRVTSMGNMFNDASSFNQDLSNWCVGDITSLPVNFSLNSPLTFESRPVWGTCPSKIAVSTISFVASATGTNSVSLPAHQDGDTILVFAFRDGTATAPGLPSGWTNINNGTGNVSARRSFFRVSDGTLTTVASANATSMIAVIYRGVGRISDLATVATASSTNVNYPANGSWVDLARTLAFAGHRSDDTDLDTTPGALVLREERLGTDHTVAFDSDNSDDAAWPATAVEVNGTASGWHSTVIRLVPELEDAL